MTFQPRRAARGVVFDPGGRLLLVQVSDASEPDRGFWWELPGGRLEDGEDSVAAVRREVLEETGVSLAEIGPCVWTREVIFRSGGRDYLQRERIHVARAHGGERGRPAPEGEELSLLHGDRWWTLAELEATEDAFEPRRLPELLPALLAGKYADPPIHLVEDWR
jgi:8-oxo-dGTP pyrophosphatase MutT (NUDIX family)